MSKTWTIEVGGVAYDYKNINFERKLKTDSPTEFTATIKYTDAVNYFDLVEIKRDNTTEWKGFVEIIDIKWTATERYLYISGRDTTVILWKKWSEDFVNMHEDTKGFFGSVSADELIKFFLRTPKSDFDPEAYPNNKEGWGIDISKIFSMTASRTSVGDPNWVKLRRNGYGWRNSGDPFASAQKVVDAIICGDGVEPNCNGQPIWSPTGVSPYLDVADDGNYIKGTLADATAIFTFEDLDATATSVEKVYLTVVWRPDLTWWFWINSVCEVHISVDGGTTWNYVGNFGGRQSPIKPNPWRYFTWKITSRVDTVAKFNALRVKFVNKSTSLATFITQAYLTAGYTTNGTQKTSDRFDIPFAEEEIMGVYVESRMDNESYPRDYDILSVENEEQDYTTYVEVDPNTHIGLVGTDHIDFDAFLNEDAYLSKDFGVAYFGNYFKHLFDFTCITDPVPDPPANGERTGIILGMWCLTDTLDDLVGLESGSITHLSLSVWRDPLNVIAGGEPVFRLHEQNGALGFNDYSSILDEGKTYTFEINRVENELTVEILEDGVYWDTISLTLHASHTFRYLMACVTANQGRAEHCDVDIDDLTLEVETILVSVTNNTYRDIIHSWTPATMNHIRIRITVEDLTCSWAITQVYIYKSEECDYRVWKETGCSPSFATDQYIQATSIDTSYTPPIGPLNVGKGRLIDVINSIVEMCHASYVPYEWWLALDVTNTFHIKNQRGTDLSGSISFVKGTNLGGANKTGDVSDTAQRIQVVGEGEGTSKNITSDWQEDTAEMANVKTFFEDVLSEKAVATKSVADELANIRLTLEAPPKTQIIVYVSNDDNASMAYNVGDDVTIEDTLTVVTGSHRIFNISKKIDDNGEQITIVLGSPFKTSADEWKDIYRRLKNLELVGVIAVDWSGQALDEAKVDVEVVTSLFEKTAKNDEENTRDTKDPSWYIVPNPAAGDYTDATGYPARTPQYVGNNVNITNGRRWERSKDWMRMWGPNAGVGTQTLLVELRGPDDEKINIQMSQNPKLVCEMQLTEDLAIPTFWKADDYFDIGIYSEEFGYGFMFRLKALGGGVFNVYAVWNLTGNVADEETQLIRTIDRNMKYRYEILTEAENGLVIFNVYDIEDSSGNPITEQKYPPSVVVMNVSSNVVVRPLYMFMSADSDSGNPNIRAVTYIYQFRTEWEKVIT